MPSQLQLNKLEKSLREYSKKYLVKKNETLDESATRIMINNFLSIVLGYIELEDIKTEYNIKNTYADYVIELNKKKQIVIEVKAISIDLTDAHLRQALGYAANEGIDWIILTNGRTFNLYRVVFSKPVESYKIFSFNLNNTIELKKSVEYFYYLTKGSLLKKEIDSFWKRYQSLEPNNICKYFYKPDFIKLLRKMLKNDSKLLFSEEDIHNSIHEVITQKLCVNKPKITKAKKPSKMPEIVTE